MSGHGGPGPRADGVRDFLGPWVDSVEELVRQVRTGDRVSVSGFHFTRAPIAQLLALADTGVRELTYVAWGGGLPLELLLDRGLVSRATLCFSSLDVLGPAPRFRRAVESGDLELDEWTALGMISGLRAAGENMAFGILQEPAGSSLTERFSRPLADPFASGLAPRGPATAGRCPAAACPARGRRRQRGDCGRSRIRHARGVRRPQGPGHGGGTGAARTPRRPAGVRPPAHLHHRPLCGPVRRVSVLVSAPLPGRLPGTARDLRRRA